MVFQSLRVRQQNPGKPGFAMQLICPSCHTAFRIEPAVLGAEGRSVRCARCRTTWFARPEDLLPAAEFVVAEAEASMPAESFAAPEPAEMPLPQIVTVDDTVMVEVDESPPLAPGASGTTDTSMLATAGSGKASDPFWIHRRHREAVKRSVAQTRLFAVAIILAAVVIATLGSRATIVRMVPGMAGLYAAIGLPVNLRGLEFRDVRTAHEVHDGIPVLLIEGEIVNVARHSVEIPRLRLAVMGAGGQEIYSWTSLLPHSVLPVGEMLPFRSRLASPPAEGKEVQVRFLNRIDLTAAGR